MFTPSLLIHVKSLPLTYNEEGKPLKHRGKYENLFSHTTSHLSAMSHTVVANLGTFVYEL